MMLRLKCPETILDNQFRCPQPGTILMGYPPLLLVRELPQWLLIPAVDNPD
jgi:hypothetical protein